MKRRYEGQLVKLKNGVGATVEDLGINVTGSDLDDAYERVRIVAKELLQIPDSSNVEIRRINGNTSMTFVLNIYKNR